MRKIKSIITYVLFTVAFPSLAFAYSDVADMSDGLSTGIKAFIAGPVKYTVMGLGFIVAATGVYKLVQSRETKEGKGQALMMIIVGVLLLSLTAFLQIMSGTLTQTDALGVDELGL